MRGLAEAVAQLSIDGSLKGLGLHQEWSKALTLHFVIIFGAQVAVPNLVVESAMGRGAGVASRVPPSLLSGVETLIDALNENSSFRI
jgi:hypothetical protein